MAIIRLGRPAEVSISAAAPWDDDFLDRRKPGETLAAFLESLDGPFVMALTAPWGSGKSTFLRRFEAHLELNAFPVIRLDVWQADYLGDPMPAFVNAVKARLTRDHAGTRSDAARIGTAIAREGAKLCGTVLGGAAKILLPGSGEAIQTIAELVSTIGKEALEFQDEHEASVRAFRKLLGDARENLAGKSNKPVIFMIDELDRCRPHFSISVLERIKHFFDVEGFIFLLATDSKNLPAAVKAVYGQGIDAERYLRKFIEYEYRLPPPAPENFTYLLLRELHLDEYLKPLTEGEALKLDLDSYIALLQTRRRAADVIEILRTFPTIATRFGLTLRDQVHAFTMIAATLRAMRPTAEALPNLLCYLVCLRFASHSMHAQLRERNFPIDQLLKPATLKEFPQMAAGAFAKTYPYKVIDLTIQMLRHSQKSERLSFLHELRRRGQNAGASKADVEMIQETSKMIPRASGLPEKDGARIVQNILSLAESFAPSISSGESAEQS